LRESFLIRVTLRSRAELNQQWGMGMLGIRIVTAGALLAFAVRAAAAQDSDASASRIDH
jgi:hypothetical protein